MRTSTRLLIVDDHDQVRRELAARLSRRLDLQVVGQADQREEALRLVAELQPDVVLLDGGMTKVLAICRAIVEKYPETKVLVLATCTDDREREEALAAGAAGYLLKDIPSEELIQSVETLRVQRHETSRRGADRLVLERSEGKEGISAEKKRPK